MVNLGDEVEDIITRFRGIAYGVVTYMYGCRRVIVQPRTGKDGKYPEMQWIDEPQVKIIKTQAISLTRKLVQTYDDNGGPVKIPRDNKVKDPGKNL